MPEFDVDALRARFPALAIEQGGRPVALFDGPGGTQVPDTVIEAVSRYYRESNANHEGPFLTSQRSDAILEDAHAALADLLNAADPSEIKFGANMTTLTMHVARSIAASLAPGDEIVVTSLDHEANVGPWRSAAADRGLVVRTVDIRPDDVTLDIEAFDAALHGRPRLVAFGWASNAVGHDQPGRRARPPRPRGGRPDLRRRRPRRPAPADRRPGRSGTDFLACSVYKFFGPHVGVLYGRRDVLDAPADLQAPARLRPVRDRDAEPRGDRRVAGGGRVHRGGGAAVRGGARVAVPGPDGPAARGPRGDGRHPRLRDAAVRAAARRPRRDPRRAAVGHRRPRAVRGADADRRRDARRGDAPRPRPVPWASRGSRPGGATSTRSARSTGSGSSPAGVLRIGLTHYNTAAEVDRLVEALREIAASRPRGLRSRSMAARAPRPDVAIVGGGIVGTALAADAGRAWGPGAARRAGARSPPARRAATRASCGIRPTPSSARCTGRPWPATGRSPTRSARSCPAAPRSARSGSTTVRRGSSCWARTAPGSGAGRRRSAPPTPSSGPPSSTRPALRRLEPGLADDLAAVRLDIGFPVAPAAAARAFAALARARGADVRVGTPATVAARAVGRSASPPADGVIEAGAVVVAAGPWSPELVDPTGAWRPILPFWGVIVELALASPPRHVLEEADIDAAIEPDAGAPDEAEEPTGFSLVSVDGRTSLGSTFLPVAAGPARLRGAAARQGRALPAGDRRHADARPPGVRPAARAGRAAAGGRGPGLRRAVHRRRPRAVGDLDRSRIGRPRRRPRARRGRSPRAGASAPATDAARFGAPPVPASPRRLAPAVRVEQEERGDRPLLPRGRQPLAEPPSAPTAPRRPRRPASITPRTGGGQCSARHDEPSGRRGDPPAIDPPVRRVAVHRRDSRRARPASRGAGRPGTTGEAGAQPWSIR